jgi:hypothetical protein
MHVVCKLKLGGAALPFCGFSHSFHKSVERLLATFLKRLRDGL